MATSIELDNVSGSWDEHHVSGDHHDLTAQVQIAQAAPADQAAAPAQTAPAAAEPVPVDVGGGAPVNAPPAANIPHEYAADASNIVKLPANVSIDNIKVDGHNLLLEQADGSVIVIKDGALNVPTFVIGDVEVPRVALIAALEASHIDVAFGADGSISAGGNGSQSSAGGNFEQPAGGIGDGFGLSALLPPTDLQFGQPDNRELFTGLVRPNSIPSIGLIGEATVSEAGLPAHNGEPAGSAFGSNSEMTSGTIGFTSPDGVSQVTLGGHALTTVPQTFTDATGSLTASYAFDAATGIGTINYSYTLANNTSGDNTSVTFVVGVTDADGDAAPPGNLTITIVDDAPVAHADTDSVAAGQFTAEAGNVITGTGTTSGAAGADTQGADGASVSHIQSDNVGGAGLDINGSTIINGQYGTLTIDASGQYSYTRNAGSAGGVNDVFTYTLKDGDTDTSTATLTIHIEDSTPTYTLPAAGDGVTTVYEAGLPARNSTEPAGSHIGATDTTASGVIAVTSVDGVASVSLNNTAVTGTSAATATTVLANSTGTLTAWYDAATSQIHYTYTLLDNTGDTNNTTISVPVSVTDKDGDTPLSGSNLTITIVDDAPVAHADTDSVAAGQF
ncbi:hypothetical protein FJ938_26390, partial [Mesorhizobium sp. B2-4-14]|uniref:Ig-like domain-containing protein n=1 Tax=Mesorhizobium sp. B2-4-14 TaxID=2589935 RepID=UPI00116F3BFD